MKQQFASCLAVFGTASDVGKSIVTAALGRVLSDAAVSVAPFKAQNISNNSGVTLQGGEIGRAQLVQALACRVEAHVDMNPVLLKPGENKQSQVVVLGKPQAGTEARRYFHDTPALAEIALSALQRLRERHAVVLIEGAGSCAEVNLRHKEFVNFPVAHAADAAVLLVADIDRGGVFAQLVGTLAVMPVHDRRRVKALLINRFCGDLRLFDDGRRYLEQKTELPVLGVVPFYHGLDVDSEDGLALHARVDPPLGNDECNLQIAVIALPHIANFTDFEPLGRLDGVRVHYLRRARGLDAYDLVILPGSKAVRSDLAWLRSQAWDVHLRDYRERLGRIAGICGGYQMLGSKLHDPLGVEGPAGTSEGLGLLAVDTHFAPTKTLCRSAGYSELFGAAVRGYEIHMGVSETAENQVFLSQLERSSASERTSDGALSDDRRVFGTYLHGLFETSEAVQGLLNWLECRSPASFASANSLVDRQSKAIDELATHFRKYVDIAPLLQLLNVAL